MKRPVRPDFAAVLVLVLGAGSASAESGGPAGPQDAPTPVTPPRRHPPPTAPSSPPTPTRTDGCAARPCPASPARSRPPIPRPAGAPFQPVARLRRVNYVDDEIFGKMDADRVAPAPLSSDSEFLRRVTLDLTGRIPDAATVAAFLADPSPDKRARMIDTLLASDAFVDRWTFFYDELFQNTAFADERPALSPGPQRVPRVLPGRRPVEEAVGRDGARDHRRHGREHLRRRRELRRPPASRRTGRSRTRTTTSRPRRRPSSSGRARSSAPPATTGRATSTRSTSGARPSSGRTSGGWRPSTRARRRRGPGRRARTTTYTVGERGTGNYLLNTTTGNKTDRTQAYYTTHAAGHDVDQPGVPEDAARPGGRRSGRRRGIPAVARPPRDGRPAVRARRRQLLSGRSSSRPASSSPPTRSTRCGRTRRAPRPARGPIQPTHPALLAKLAQDYAGHGYDLRYILGVMAKSSAYQLSSFYPGTWSEAYAPYFARHFARRLTAEETFDAITRATGVPASIPVSGGMPNVAWAMQLPDVQEPGGGSVIGNFLNTFLRADRDGDTRSNEFSISQALLMLNDTTVTNRIKSTAAGSAVRTLITANATPDADRARRSTSRRSRALRPRAELARGRRALREPAERGDEGAGRGGSPVRAPQQARLPLQLLRAAMKTLLPSLPGLRRDPRERARPLPPRLPPARRDGPRRLVVPEVSRLRRGRPSPRR